MTKEPLLSLTGFQRKPLTLEDALAVEEEDEESSSSSSELEDVDPELLELLSVSAATASSAWSTKSLALSPDKSQPVLRKRKKNAVSKSNNFFIKEGSIGMGVVGPL